MTTLMLFCTPESVLALMFALLQILLFGVADRGFSDLPAFRRFQDEPFKLLVKLSRNYTN